MDTKLSQETNTIADSCAQYIQKYVLLIYFQLNTNYDCKGILLYTLLDGKIFLKVVSSADVN